MILLTKYSKVAACVLTYVCAWECVCVCAYVWLRSRADAMLILHWKRFIYIKS